MIHNLLNMPYSINYDLFLEKKEILEQNVKKSGANLYILNSNPENLTIYSPFYNEFESISYNNKTYKFRNESIRGAACKNLLNEEKDVLQVQVSCDEFFKSFNEKRVESVVIDLIETIYYEIRGDADDSEKDLFLNNFHLESSSRKSIKAENINVPYLIEGCRQFLHSEKNTKSIHFKKIEELVLKSIAAIEKDRDLIYFWNIYWAFSLNNSEVDCAVFVLEIPY